MQRMQNVRVKTVDPITLSAARGVLEITQREVTMAQEKATRSLVFNLAHDCFTALFKRTPEMILHKDPDYVGGHIIDTWMFNPVF